MKARALLDSARERGEDPRKVVFGGRKLFETLRRRHLSGKPLKRAKQVWKEKRHLSLLSSLQGSPGSQREVTDGRNSPGVNPWRVLRVGTFLPLLGREVPRDLSPLKPILFGDRGRGGREA